MRDIPFHKPCIEQDEIDGVVDTLKNGWLTMGPKTFSFEEAFRKKVKAKHAVSFNSCTAALHMALRVLDLQPDDEVIVPTMTFTATGEVVRYFNAKPVIVDVERDTHNISPAMIERHLTPKTRVIMPIHFGGQPADMDEIQEIAAARNLRVVEDAAHCFPSFYQNRPVGTLGDITAFSFYATKTLAIGEGGIATTHSDEFAEQFRVLRLHGISKDAWKRYGKGGDWFYEVVDFGYKYNMTDIQAALGLAQLRKANRMWARRKQIAARYTEAFQECPDLLPPVVRKDRQTSWHLYVLKLRIESLNIARNQFIQEMRSRGISLSVHFIPLHRHPVYRHALQVTPAQFPHAEWLYERSVSLPIFPTMTDAEVDCVIEGVLDVVCKHRKQNHVNRRIPLAKPDITCRERQAVADVMETPNLSFGPKVPAFEEAMARYAGRKYAVAVNSGTSALHLIVRGLGLGEGDQVITTPFSFIASANCLLFERAVPVFVDIDRNTLNMDPEKVEAMLRRDRKKKIKAILAVDIFGHPADWDALYDLADRYQVMLIEDSSEALGAEYRSPAGSRRRRWVRPRKAGWFGEASVFAFYPNKQITTGEGGVILTNNKKLYQLCQSMRNQGRDENAEWFCHARLGYNYRISDINCALGLAQLERVDEILRSRAHVASRYNSLLGSVDGLVLPFCAPNVRIGWFVYVVQLPPSYSRQARDTVLSTLRDKGIDCSNYFSPIHLQPLYKKTFGFKGGEFPITEDVSNRTIALPFFGGLKDSEIQCVAREVQKILNQ